MPNPSALTPTRLAIAGLALLAAGLVAAELVQRARYQGVRDALWEELEPVPLANCEMGRLGKDSDGGYVVCTNLLDRVKAAYSYGIAGEDSFGCAISERLGIEVHQYDCFDTTRVDCPNATAIFHEECVGARAETIDGRAFDSIANQIATSGHAGEQVFMKMDIDGGEVDSLLATGPETFARIDQIAIELHGVSNPDILAVVRHLKQHYVVADVHFNNFACKPGREPFPSSVPEVLFVHKDLAQVDPDGVVPFPNPGWFPNDPSRPDCQKAW